MKWYFRAWKNYAVFSGRARRKEYWMFFLFHAILLLIGSAVMSITGGLTLILPFLAILIPLIGGLIGLYSLATFLPFLGLLVRRLHDTDRSGWWILIFLIPIAGAIWLIVLLATEGNLEANKYGPNPKEDKLLDEPFSQNLE